MKVVRILLCFLILVLLLYFLFCFLKEAGGNDVHPHGTSSIYDGTWHPMEGDPPPLRNRGTGNLYRDRIPMPPLRTAKGPPAPVSLGQGPHRPTRDRQDAHVDMTHGHPMEDSSANQLNRGGLVDDVSSQISWAKGPPRRATTNFFNRLEEGVPPDETLGVRITSSGSESLGVRTTSSSSTETSIKHQSTMNPSNSEFIGAFAAGTVFKNPLRKKKTDQRYFVHDKFPGMVEILSIKEKAFSADVNPMMDIDLQSNYKPKKDPTRRDNPYYSAETERITPNLIYRNFYEKPYEAHIRALPFIVARFFEFKDDFESVNGIRSLLSLYLDPLRNPSVDSFDDLYYEGLNELQITVMKYYVKIAEIDLARNMTVNEHAEKLYEWMVSPENYRIFWHTFRLPNHNVRKFWTDYPDPVNVEKKIRLPKDRPKNITSPTHPFRIMMTTQLRLRIINAIFETKVAYRQSRIVFIHKKYTS